MKATSKVLPTEDEFKRFVRPWDFDNDLGVPEVDADELEIREFLGSGKKAKTKRAVWRGKTVALKRCSRKHELDSWAQWELARYCDLKAIQGTLIPKLYFVSRDKVYGTRLFGLEMVEVASEDDHRIHDEMDQLNEKLKKSGWMQRCHSWRPDNVVWMRNEDGSKRLVAIDLEAWIPSFSPESPPPPLTNYNRFLYGLPVVSPTEVRINVANNQDRWELREKYGTGIWREVKDVSIMKFEADRFKVNMERYLLLENEYGALLPRPLFLVQAPSGSILVGFEKFQLLPYNEEVHNTLSKRFLSLGWDLPEKQYQYGLASLVGSDKKQMIATDLYYLKRAEIPTDLEPTDDEESSSGSGSDQTIHVTLIEESATPEESDLIEELSTPEESDPVADKETVQPVDSSAEIKADPTDDMSSLSGSGSHESIHDALNEECSIPEESVPVASEAHVEPPVASIAA